MGPLFINGTLAFGAALAAIPVIIHLVMRQKPKRVVFPALRLIRQRHQRTTKRLRVQNWLLLLARMALVALMALALARPRISSPSPLGTDEVPTALALVFDTSASMGYLGADGRSRLDEAKAHALEIVRRAPGTSRVFVIDSSEPGIPLGYSPAAARQRIEALTVRAARRPLNEAVGRAYTAVAASDRPRHEVYVLTDLARSAWDVTRQAEGLDKAQADKMGVETYLLRLSPQEVRDAALVEAEVRPAASVATRDEQVEVWAKVRSVGAAAQRVVEFFLDGQPRAKQSVSLPAGGEVEVRFRTPKLAEGLHEGRLVLTGGKDPLEFDDTRYLSFQVHYPFRVLVVSDAPDDAFYVAAALDPTALPPGEPRPYLVDRIATSRLGDLLQEGRQKDYAAIFLLNLKSLSDAEWSRLNAYVRSGGGLTIGLGPRVDSSSYKTLVAAQLLPATPGAVKTPSGGTSFGRFDAAHPLFRRAPQDLGAELSGVPIARYQAVEPAKGSRALLVYQDNAPALIERTFPGPRSGHVLLWTTALTRDPARPTVSWNDFPLSWSFLYLMDQSVPYLAGVASERLNYEAGEDVYLPIDPTRSFTNYTVRGPGQNPQRLSAPNTRASLVIEAPRQVGPWTVTATGPDGQEQRLGFSVNPPASEAELAALDPPALNTLFGGPDRYKLADDPEGLRKAIHTSRFGHEVFPWLMALILALVTAENTLANLYYREQRATA